MSIVVKRMWRLVAVLSIGVSVSACSALLGPKPTGSVPAVHASPTALQPPSCASSEFALPESVLQAGEVLDLEEADRREIELGRQQYGWLSVHIALTRNVVRYGDPIPLRFTITNETDHPVIFVRPQNTEFLYDSFYPPYHPNFSRPSYISAFLPPTSFSPTQIYVALDPFPDEIRPLGESRLVELESLLQPQGSFSMLRPGQSCTAEGYLVWNKTVEPLAEPIPPGNYTLWVFLRGTGLGPDIDPVRYTGEIIDVGGWVGCSEASNAVTLTILPLDRQQD